MDSVGLRVQNLTLKDQTLVLVRLAGARSEDRSVAPGDVESVFVDAALPRPARMSNTFAALEKEGLLTRRKGTGRVWKLTPKGKDRAQRLATDVDLALLAAEADERGTALGGQAHSIVPPNLAPAGLLGALGPFLKEHPFDRNIFGMTRFPSDADEEAEEDNDPVGPALHVARAICQAHGLEFHLASDRALVDDLWGNVTAHMWACRYGIAFFENRVGRGLNYNLTIEVGAMLLAGRRCALMKDKSMGNMPTDLVGHIYRSVDLTDPKSVEKSLSSWIKEDLGLT